MLTLLALSRHFLCVHSLLSAFPVADTATTRLAGQDRRGFISKFFPDEPE
ncbi:hypothetical protein [Citrobacter portucalensis]